MEKKSVPLAKSKVTLPTAMLNTRPAEAMSYNTARQMELHQAGLRVDSDGTKLITATLAKNIADRAMQVLGGYGYVSEYKVERLWRDAKLLEIGGGTLEAHQKNIAKDLSLNPSFIDKSF